MSLKENLNFTLNESAITSMNFYESILSTKADLRCFNELNYLSVHEKILCLTTTYTATAELQTPKISINFIKAANLNMNSVAKD